MVALKGNSIMDDNKALFDYWHDRVQLKNHAKIAAIAQHIPVHELRHECTNYDTLRQSTEVQKLADPERSHNIAIIKYQCTAKVLQYRAGCLRDRANELEDSSKKIHQQKSQLLHLIKALQEKLFGKDQELQKLETRITSLSAENEALRSELESTKAAEELHKELEQLKKQYKTVEKRRRELAKNNQSLGGRVAHTERYKRERDEARALVAEKKRQILNLTQENQELRATNEKFLRKLKSLAAEPTLG
jgi:chromosome segregation ATPase